MSSHDSRAPRYNLMRARPNNDKNIESTISLSKDIKNTLLIDTIAFKFLRKNYSALEKNYDSIVLVRNEAYFFTKLMCRPASIAAGTLSSQPEDRVRLPEPRQDAAHNVVQRAEARAVRADGRPGGDHRVAQEWAKQRRTA